MPGSQLQGGKVEVARGGLRYLRRMRAHHCLVRAQIYYVHVHKSGGTTLCQAAGANGLKVSLGTNCLYKDKTGKPVSTW